MVDTSSTMRWRVCGIKFPRETAVLVVIAVFVTFPNHQFHGVTARPGEFGGGRQYNYQSKFGRPYGYQLEEDFYSPYNPLWREEQVYTGERRGPITDPSSMRRRRRSNPPPNSPLTPHIQDVDEVSSSSYFSEFPLQSADIGSTGIGSNDIYPSDTQNPRGGSTWSFPIDFKRKRGRLNIGAPADNGPEMRPPPRLLAAKAAISKSSSKDAHSSGGKGEPETPARTPLNRRGNIVKARDDQVSFSLDPFSLAILLRNSAMAIMGIGSVYIATLKILGPMILAKHCLAKLGSIVNDKFQARLFGKDVQQIEYLEEKSLDIHRDSYGAARAAGRSLFQILCMTCTGGLAVFLLDQTRCRFQPFWICQWLYAIAWLASVHAVGFLCEELVFGSSRHSYLSIKPAFGLTDSTPNKKIVDPRGRGNMARSVFRFCRKMSQNPEEWMHGLFRRVPQWQKRESEVSENVEVDPLLFPSTWKPLSMMTYLAFIRAICQSFYWKKLPADLIGTLGDAAFTENKQYIIMLSFIIQKVLYSEWNRVFLQERRVALGSGVSLIGLITLTWSIYNVATVDYIAALAMIPTLMARMLSTWISILLAYNQIAVSSETMTWRDLASRLNMAKV